jgi:NADH-quinone oxidoreductase subunit A
LNAPALPAAPLWPLVVYFAAVLILVVGMLALSYVLGQRHHQRATGEPYESGVVPTGSARLRFDAMYYLVAMIFLIFDLESVIIFAWAIAFREVGWLGYIQVLIFIAVLIAALAYIWKEGVLDWGPRRIRRPARTGSNGVGTIRR